MSKNTQTKQVYVNEAYLRKYFEEHGLQLRTQSLKIGKCRAYINACLSSKSMDATAMLLLCHITGMDYDKATAKEATIEKKKADTSGTTDGVSSDELKELTELVVSYIQDIGKIHTDSLREMRELRSQIMEISEKTHKELHDLGIYLRNSGAEARKSREATNNKLSTACNYLEKKLEQQR